MSNLCFTCNSIAPKGLEQELEIGEIGFCALVDQGRIMNNRRRMLIALGAGALTTSFYSNAQSQKVHRVGYLAAGSAQTNEVPLGELVRGLKALGYVEGQNLTLVRRFAEGRLERLPALALEMVAAGVDLIVVTGTTPGKAAREATSSIPIVFNSVTDPVGSGFVQSLARPGYNMTGLSHINADLAAKRLEILKELSPNVSRVAVLVSGEPHVVQPQLEQVQIGAKQLGISLQIARLLRREDFDSVSKQLRAQRADAIFVIDSTTNRYNKNLIVELAAKLRLPAMYAADRYTDAGGLICYGANAGASNYRIAYYVDRILKGANPSDLPVELPTHFELVINMKAAKALGIKIPQSLLLRADRLIE